MISDERLDQLLTDYCKAEPQQSFVFTPKAKREKVVPFARYRRTAAAAAALVFVSVLSLAVYFLFGNKPNTPITVSPSPHAATTPSAAQGESGGTEPGTAPSETTGEKKPDIIEWIESIFTPPTQAPNGGNAPTISPTEKAAGPTVPAATSPHATEKGTEKPPQVPTQQSTPKPTQKPTQPPTDAPWEPIEDETRYDGPDLPVPTEGGSDEPWEPPVDTTEPQPTDPPSFTATFTASFSSDKLGGSGTVYCRLYNSSGRMIGDSNVYAPSHIAAIVGECGATVTASYTAPRGLITQPGNYNYIFYNENGKRLAQGQAYVG